MQLFTACGFVIDEMLKNVSPIPKNFEKMFKELKEGMVISQNVFDFLDTYQFVIKAGKIK